MITWHSFGPRPRPKRANLYTRDRSAKNLFAVPERSESESHHIAAPPTHLVQGGGVCGDANENFSIRPSFKARTLLCPGCIIYSHTLSRAWLECLMVTTLFRRPSRNAQLIHITASIQIHTLYVYVDNPARNYNTFGSDLPPSTGLQLPGHRTA